MSSRLSSWPPISTSPPHTRPSSRLVAGGLLVVTPSAHHGSVLASGSGPLSGLAELDQALADGADPRESRELALRAHQLTKPGKRIRFARAIEKVVSDVGSPEPQILLGIYRRDPVLKNRVLLRALADRLRAEAPVRLRGLAMAISSSTAATARFMGPRAPSSSSERWPTSRRALEPEAVDPVPCVVRAPDSSDA